MKILSNEDFTKIADDLMDRVIKDYPEDNSPVNIIAAIAINICNGFFQEYEKLKNE